MSTRCAHWSVPARSSSVLPGDAACEFPRDDGEAAVVHLKAVVRSRRHQVPGFGAIDNHVRCRLEKGDDGLCLVRPRRFRPPLLEVLPAESAPVIDPGLLAYQVKWTDGEGIRLAISRDMDDRMDRLARVLGASPPPRTGAAGFFGLFARKNRAAVQVECGTQATWKGW